MMIIEMVSRKNSPGHKVDFYHLEAPIIDQCIN